MKTVKKGDLLVCAECGVEVEVKTKCDSSDCEIVCCGQPMNLKDRSSDCCCCC